MLKWHMSHTSLISPAAWKIITFNVCLITKFWDGFVLLGIFSDKSWFVSLHAIAYICDDESHRLPWGWSLFEMVKLRQFLHVLWNFEIFPDNLAAGKRDNVIALILYRLQVSAWNLVGWCTMKQIIIIPPASTKLKGEYTGITLSVCSSVCLLVSGQNPVCSVSSTPSSDSISYLHIWSSNFRRCVAYNGRFNIKNLKFW